MHIDKKTLIHTAALVCACIGSNAWAQSPELPNAMMGWRGAELYTAEHHLSQGYGNWHETGARGIFEMDQHQIAAEAITMKRFNESGNYFALGDTVVLDPNWYASLALGGGDGAAYLPRYRADAFLHRKLLDDKRLVTSLGIGHYKSPDDHRDDTISLGATYYFEQPWIMQGEVKHTHSNPGHVGTEQYFVAATWGLYKQTRITGRYGWGEEGYQSLGNGNGFISRFSSHQSSLSVQHWIGSNWGIKASAEDYKNPYYRRNGLSVAVFKDLP
jgi:YaiO family outer membrane protein